MTNFKRFITIFLLAAIPFLQACNNNDDDIPPLSEYAVGVIISNEGNFMQSNASVSFYNRESKEVENNIFEKVNDNRPIGDVLQSMFFDLGKGYLVVNNSNKVEVVEDGTFRSLGTIESELANPRYMAAFNNKGYITNWGNYDENWQLDQSYIAVVDLNTLEVTNKINVDLGAERIVIQGNKIYVSNTYSSKVTIINLTQEEVEAVVELSDGPNGIVVDGNGVIWVLCKGTWQGNDGKLFAIDPTLNTIIKEFELNRNASGDLVTNAEKTRVFYSSGKSIFEVLTSADQISGSAIITNDDMIGSIYGFAIDPRTNVIYVSDAENFTGNGKVFTLQPDGTVIDVFEAGIIPNGFWFK